MPSTLCRLTQFVRNTVIELSHHEHTECGKCLQTDHCEQLIIQSHLTHHDKLRNHVYLPRHSDGRNVCHEQCILMLELQFCKRVCCKAACQKL